MDVRDGRRPRSTARTGCKLRDSRNLGRGAGGEIGHRMQYRVFEWIRALSISVEISRTGTRSSLGMLDRGVASHRDTRASGVDVDGVGGVTE